MAEAATSTSSVGAVWPPEFSSNNRLRGFYETTLEDESDAEQVANALDQYRADAVAQDIADRVSIRAVGTVGAIHVLDQLGVTLEGALPIRDSDRFVIYTAWNAPDRQASDETLIEHRTLIASMVNYDPRPHAVRPTPLEVEFIDASTDAKRKAELATKFTDLYGAFGYDQAEVEYLLDDENNIIAFTEDQKGILSTAMAERADIAVDGHGVVRMAEITEAITRPNRRGEGLYREISRQLVSYLKEVSPARAPLDIIYGESNLTMKGVIIAARQNGRRFSHLDRTDLGISQPNFGILQQNFKVADGVETRQYNDFALSYFALD